MKKAHKKQIITCLLIALAALISLFFILNLNKAADNYENNKNIIICIAVLLMSMILFATEMIPAAITAILVPVVLSFPGIDVLSGKEAFKNFGEQWTVTFLAMYIIGYAIIKTGFASKIGAFIVRLSGGSQKRAMALLCLILGICSSFLSNAACMALFAPIIVAIAHDVGTKPSKLLMPVSFAIILGGNMTLIGASSKGIINGIMETYALRPFQFFAYLPVGGIMFIIGLIYLILIANKSIPLRETGTVERITSDDRLMKKAPYAAFSFIFAVITIATEIIPPATAAMFGASIVVVSGCISLKEAFQAVSWSSIFIFAGMLALGDALQKSGADIVVAQLLVKNLTSPLTLYLIVYTICLALTSFMSNSATAAVLLPIAITSAVQLGQNPMPYCMAIGIASSLDFITPFGNGTCTIAYELGGYKFMDFIKVGLPLQLICALSGAIAIPVFFPF